MIFKYYVHFIFECNLNANSVSCNENGGYIFNDINIYTSNFHFQKIWI